MDPRYDGMGRPLTKTAWLHRLIVNRYTRLLQLCLYTTITILSLIVSIVVLVTFEKLNHKCPLYASPRPNKIEFRKENGTAYLYVKEVDFGDEKTCKYSLYMNATTSVYSCVWGALFAIVTSNKYAGKGYNRRIIFPSLLLNSVVFTCQLISSLVLTLGFAHWCNGLIQAVNHASQNPHRHDMQLRCPVLQTLEWRSENSIIREFRGPRMFALLTFTQILSWLLSISTFLLSVICAERFFKLIWHGDLDRQSNSSSNNLLTNTNTLNGHPPQVTQSQQIAMKPTAMRSYSCDPDHTVVAGSESDPNRNTRHYSVPSKIIGNPGTSVASIGTEDRNGGLQSDQENRVRVTPIKGRFSHQSTINGSTPPEADTKRPLYLKQPVSRSTERETADYSPINSWESPAEVDPLLSSISSQQPLLTPKFSFQTPNSSSAPQSGAQKPSARYLNKRYFDQSTFESLDETQVNEFEIVSTV